MSKGKTLVIFEEVFKNFNLEPGTTMLWLFPTARAAHATWSKMLTWLSKQDVVYMPGSDHSFRFANGSRIYLVSERQNPQKYYGTNIQVYQIDPDCVCLNKWREILESGLRRN